MQINHCLRCNHEWPSKLEKSRTCSKCRSPYWDVPRTTDAVDPNCPVADLPVEKNPAEASPIIEINPFTALVEKRLHPERTDEQRQKEISDLRGLLDISGKKGNESVLPDYPPNVDEYGPIIAI